MLALTLTGPDLGRVDPFQQTTLYTCSAASLHAVLKHWGYEASEQSLAEIIGAKPLTGATNEQVVTAAKRLGFHAELRRFNSIAGLKKITDRDIPVMLNVESFIRPGQGHFVIATKVDAYSITLMDPNAATNWRTISRAELDRRWRDRGRIGIIVMPRGREVLTGFGADTVTAGRPPRWVAPVAVASLLLLTAIVGTISAVIYEPKKHRR